MSKTNGQDAPTVKEKMFEDMKGKLPDVIFPDGERPAYLDNPLTVSTLLEMEKNREIVRSHEDYIAQVEADPKYRDAKKGMSTLRPVLTKLAGQFHEQTGEKTVLFGCGKVQYRSESDSFDFDKDEVARCIIDVTAFTDRMRKRIAPQPNGEDAPVSAAADDEAIDSIIDEKLEGADKALVAMYIRALRTERDLAVQELDAVKTEIDLEVQGIATAIGRLAATKKDKHQNATVAFS